MLIAVSKGMQAVKLCSNKIHQFLITGDALAYVNLYYCHKTAVVVVLEQVCATELENFLDVLMSLKNYLFSFIHL